MKQPPLCQLHCLQCGLQALTIPGPSQLWLTPYHTRYCPHCERLHHTPEDETHCPQHGIYQVRWQLGQPCPRCGGVLQIDPHGLQVSLTVSLW